MARKEKQWKNNNKKKKWEFLLYSFAKVVYVSEACQFKSSQCLCGWYSVLLFQKTKTTTTTTTNSCHLQCLVCGGKKEEEEEKTYSF